MAKCSDDKIQEAVHDYRLAVAESRDGKSLARAAYSVAEAYADVSINHTSWKDERRASKWIRKAESHSPQLAYESGWFNRASRKLTYLENRRMERFDVLKYIAIFCGVTAVGLILFMAYGILTFHK